MITKKHITSLALSAALMLSSTPAFAFVTSPGTGSTTLKDAFEVTGLTITDASVVTQGMRACAPLTDTSKQPYGRDQLMYYGLTIMVNNPTKTLAHTSAVGSEYVIEVSSKSADLSINSVTDVVLTHPHELSTSFVSTENGAVKAGTSDALTYDKDTNTLGFKAKVWSDAPKNSNVNVGNEAFNLAIDESASAAAVNYTIGFTGVNRSADPGAVTANVSPTEFRFKNDEVTVDVFGRTYNIKKIPAVHAVRSDASNWPEVVKNSLSTIGYRISRVNPDKSLTEIVTLDTEVTSAEGYGQSLGMAKDGRMITMSAIGGRYVYADDSTAAFTDAERAEFETMMKDFGFSTSYGYKLQDRNFEQATTYEASFTAIYNVKDADVGETTPDSDLNEDEETDQEIIEDDIVEEVIPDEDIIEDELPDEDILEELPFEDEDEIFDEVITDEETDVPKTGDFAAAGTFAAMAAAAGAAFAAAMKRIAKSRT